MAGPLGKLVDLTTLSLWSTWHGGVGCVSRVYAWRAVSSCAWEVVAVCRCVTDVDGVCGVCVGTRQ